MANDITHLGMIGLGRMGANLVRRITDAGLHAVAYDATAGIAQQMATENSMHISAATSIDDLIAQLPSPRAVWVMVPAGETTRSVIAELITKLDNGDIIIDGGNSYYRDDLAHSVKAAERGITFIDVGTSGGVWGRERGYCLMIGGDTSAVNSLRAFWEAIAPGFAAAQRTPNRTGDISGSENGWLHCGPAGSGHFVKMIHNGIEYGMMASYAEGFNILKNAAQTPGQEHFIFDIPEIAELWRRGSVVSSWLLDLTAIALQESPTLEEFSGNVSDSGEGRWTSIAAIEAGVPAPVLTTALFSRFESRGNATFANKVLSAMRKQFGGHQEKKD